MKNILYTPGIELRTTISKHMSYPLNYVESESDYIAKPYIDHSSLKAHILFLT